MAEEPEPSEGLDLAFQYPSVAVQRDTDRLGMWMFLATEVMMFGAVFMALTVYRTIHPAAMRAAAAHLHLAIGAANTAILLAGSALVALAEGAALAGRRREAAWELGAAALMGVLFVALKMTEWYLEYTEGLMPGISPRFALPQPAERLFFDLYYLATGLHALHLTVGVLLIGGLALRIAVGRLPVPERGAVVGLAGLYWQFVDVVWIFLFPVLYLASPR